MSAVRSIRRAPVCPSVQGCGRGFGSNCKQRISVRQVATAASSAEYIATAEGKIAANDMLGALRQYELAMSTSEDLPVDLQRKILYNTCAIHAGFGDLELAQVPLRAAIGLGLDFEAAAAAAPTEPGMVPLKAPRQVVISLKRFAQRCKDNVREERPAYNPTKGLQLTPAGVRTAFAEEDIQDLTGTEMKGDDMDKSLSGIFKRVALLLLVLVSSGVGLFFLGLKLAFPDGI